MLASLDGALSVSGGSTTAGVLGKSWADLDFDGAARRAELRGVGCRATFARCSSIRPRTIGRFTKCAATRDAFLPPRRDQPIALALP
jgi:hypothetical protein